MPPLIQEFVASAVYQTQSKLNCTVRLGVPALHPTVNCAMEKYGAPVAEPPKVPDEEIRLLTEHSLKLVQHSWQTVYETEKDKLHFFVMRCVRRQHRWSEALKVGYKMVEIFNERYGVNTDHSNTAGVLDTIGTVLHDQGKLQEAEEELNKALKMKQRLHGDGGDLLSVCITLNALGGVKERLATKNSDSLGDPDELYRGSLKILHLKYGEYADHTEIANTRRRLASIRWRQGLLSDVEEMYGKC